MKKTYIFTSNKCKKKLWWLLKKEQYSSQDIKLSTVLRFGNTHSCWRSAQFFICVSMCLFSWRTLFLLFYSYYIVICGKNFNFIVFYNLFIYYTFTYLFFYLFVKLGSKALLIIIFSLVYFPMLYSSLSYNLLLRHPILLDFKRS